MRSLTTAKPPPYGLSKVTSSTGGQQSEYYAQQRQVSVQKQKVVTDQHHSNNILMTILSTLESLAAKVAGSSITSKEKVYGYYDKVDYSQKSLN